MIINSSNNHKMIGKVKEKNEQISNYSDLDKIEIPQTNNLNERVYCPTWENRPESVSVSIKAKYSDTTLCKTGGHLLICAGAGVGKSSIVEAVISSVLNPECDSLGIQIILPELNQKVLILDTERSQGETWDAWLNIMRRANINNPSIDDRLIFANCKSLNVIERKEYVTKILSENEDIGLVVFDGSGDFVTSVNDEKECNSFNDWVNTFNPLISMIHTIHTNPKDNKPRGWLGSELWRRANSVLLAKKLLDEGIIELTSDFNIGKVRHGDSFSHYFCFDTEMGMFVSTTYAFKSKKEEAKINKETSIKELLIKVWNGESVIKYSEMINRLMKELDKDKNGAINFYKYNFKVKGKELIEKIGKEGWKIIG